MMRTFVVPLFALLPLPALAAPDEAVVKQMARDTRLPPEDIRTYYNACDSGVTLHMKICAAYKFTVEDIRLNQVYKKALARAKPLDAEQPLIQAQRAWVAFRDAACSFEGTYGAGGGTAEGLFVLGCKIDLTRERADRLDRLASER